MSGKHVSVLDKGAYLLVTCPPCHDADDCMACLDGMYDALELFGKSKILADFTATPEPIPIMAPNVNSDLTRQYASNGIQVAVVTRQGVVDTKHFLEDIAARDKPIAVSVFVEDFDAALSWLND